MGALNWLQALTQRAKTDKPCADCHKVYPPCVMHFDHIPELGPKLFQLSTAHSGKHTEAEVWDEIRKCEIVCANCHAMRTNNRSHGKRAWERPPRYPK